MYNNPNRTSLNNLIEYTFVSGRSRREFTRVYSNLDHVLRVAAKQHEDKTGIPVKLKYEGRTFANDEILRLCSQRGFLK